MKPLGIAVARNRRRGATNGPQFLWPCAPDQVAAMTISRARTTSCHRRLANAAVQPASDAPRLICGKDDCRHVTDLREAADKSIGLTTDLHLIRARRGQFKHFVCKRSCNRANLLQVFTQTCRVAQIHDTDAVGGGAPSRCSSRHREPVLNIRRVFATIPAPARDGHPLNHCHSPPLPPSPDGPCERAKSLPLDIMTRRTCQSLGTPIGPVSC